MEGNGKMKKGTVLLTHMKKEPLSYSDMQRLLKSTKKTPEGYVTEKGWRDRKDNQGYWCTNLAYFKWSSKVIEKGKDGLYKLTAAGIKNINHPFKSPWKPKKKEPKPNPNTKEYSWKPKPNPKKYRMRIIFEDNELLIYRKF